VLTHKITVGCKLKYVNKLTIFFRIIILLIIDKKYYNTNVIKHIIKFITNF
jgi:hypothetical protein